MDIRLLGPVEAWNDGRRLDLGPRQQRLILAVLALEPGRAVPVKRLVGLLWPDQDPPRSARNTVQVRVSGLRTALGDAAPLMPKDGGYALLADPDAVDAQRFRSLLAAARTSGAPADRVRLLRQALGLWRGPALAGVSPNEELRERLARDLTELRLLAYEDLMEAELVSGNPTRLLGELAELTTEHPDSERLQRARVSALARAGEVGRALTVARAYRARLAEEYGLDPSQQFRELELAVLREELPRPGSDDRGEPRPAAVPHAQLPAAVPHFTGRNDELRALDGLLPAPGEEPASLALVTGPGGAGKTAVAVRWAHSAAGRFPDGQLYVDLRGYSAEPPLRPIEALGQLLQSIGVAAAGVPATLEPAVAAYRSRLAGTRTLVLLDNAADPEQVRPLLPGGAGCLALVTSRNKLSGLVAVDGGRRVALEPLGVGDATELLESLLGRRRVAAEPDAVCELIELCDGLPLALRIAAEQLADARPIADYVRDLRAEPVDQLTIEGDERSSVAHVFGLSFRRLEAAERRLFRLLSVIPGSDYGIPAVAAVLGAPVSEARRLLRHLASAHLVREHRPGRYQQHDLLRYYAAALAAEEGEQTLLDARDRLFTWYYRCAERLVSKHSLSTPLRDVRPAEPVPEPDVDPDDPMAWFDLERDNLVAAAGRAADAGPREWAWWLGWPLRIPFRSRGTATDEARLADAAMRAATAGGDPYGLCVAHRIQAHGAEDRDRELHHLLLAAEYAEQTGDAALLGAAQCAIGGAYDRLGQARLGYDYLRLGVAAKQSAPDPGDLSGPLSDLGNAAVSLGMISEGLAYFKQARAFCETTGAVSRLPSILGNLCNPLKYLGRLKEAAEVAREATDLAVQLGDLRRECFASMQAAGVQSEAGNGKQALTFAERALELATGLGRDHEIAGALVAKGEALLQLAEPRQAAGVLEEALRLAAQLGDTRLEIEISALLAGAEHQLGRHERARDRCLSVVELTRDEGNVPERAAALIVLSAAELGLGNRAGALVYAHQALDTASGLGWAGGQARAQAALAQASPEPGTDGRAATTPSPRP